MFNIGDKVIYNLHPDGLYYNEFGGRNLEGKLFKVVDIWDKESYWITPLDWNFESPYSIQIVHPLHLTLYKGETDE